MTTKIKTTLLTAFLFFVLLTGLQAQDKYDFAIVFIEYDKIVVVENNQSVQKIDIPKRNELYVQTALLLSQISKMTENGWELIDINGYVYHLKRKSK